MAHTAECAAPEGSQDRDEWMTVIEMQEYMRASRNKAYDLIWSGEIDSYRLGRKLLVSRASVDAYIESRSGSEMTAATAREPPAAGHAREPETKGALRTHHDQEHYRSQVRLIASTNAIFGARRGVRDAAHQPQRHVPARPLHLPSEHAIRLLVAHCWLPPSAGGVPRLFFYPFH